MTTTEKPLAELVQELPPDLQTEIRDFVEFLLEKRRRAVLAEAEQHTMENGWPPGYFDRTAGALPDFPEIDHDTGGIDPSLDEHDELRFDPSAGDDSQCAA